MIKNYNADFKINMSNLIEFNSMEILNLISKLSLNSLTFTKGAEIAKISSCLLVEASESDCDYSFIDRFKYFSSNSDFLYYFIDRFEIFKFFNFFINKMNYTYSSFYLSASNLFYLDFNLFITIIINFL